jgi:hypothetical protein
VHRDVILVPTFADCRSRAHTDAMPDDDDRPRDAGSAADPAWSLAAAPDDIRSLAPDIAAYHRELRSAGRRKWFRRFFARPGITALAMTVAGLALAAVVATMLSVIDPHGPHNAPSALPLAAHPSAAVGQVHGLLPDVALQDVEGNSLPSRTLRPAVLALISLHCDCAGLLNGFADAAASAKLPLVVVAPTVADAEATALSGQLTHGQTEIVYDRTGALATDFGVAGTGVTLVVLDRDGTVFHVQQAVPSTASSHLSTLLQQMLAPTAQAGG